MKSWRICLHSQLVVSSPYQTIKTSAKQNSLHRKIYSHDITTKSYFSFISVVANKYNSFCEHYIICSTTHKIPKKVTHKWHSFSLVQLTTSETICQHHTFSIIVFLLFSKATIIKNELWHIKVLEFSEVLAFTFKESCREVNTLWFQFMWFWTK